MNHGREPGSRKKPIKSRRPGYTGAREQRRREAQRQEKILKEKRSKTTGEFMDYLRRRFGIKVGAGK